MHLREPGKRYLCSRSLNLNDLVVSDDAHQVSNCNYMFIFSNEKVT